VNGAAGNFLCPIAGLSYNAFRYGYCADSIGLTNLSTVLEIDTMGTYNVSKAAFEAYLRDHGGIIINITATLHYVGHPLQVSYDCHCMEFIYFRLMLVLPKLV